MPQENGRVGGRTSCQNIQLLATYEKLSMIPPLAKLLWLLFVAAVLDEATSQVGLAMERMLYATCARLNITLFSVGRRDSLQEFHQLELHIGPAGRWQLLPLQSSSVSDPVSVTDSAAIQL